MENLAFAMMLEVQYARYVERGGDYGRAEYLAWCQVVYIRRAMEALNVPESD